jgi:hypothetical protein
MVRRFYWRSAVTRSEPMMPLGASRVCSRALNPGPSWQTVPGGQAGGRADLDWRAAAPA